MKRTLRLLAIITVIALCASYAVFASAEGEMSNGKLRVSNSRTFENAQYVNMDMCIYMIYHPNRTAGPFGERPSTPLYIVYDGAILDAVGSYKIRSEKIVYKLYHYYVDLKFDITTAKEPGIGYVYVLDANEKVIYGLQINVRNHHEIVNVPAVAPTCQHEGNTEGTKCEYCSHVFKEPTTLPKIDHNWILKETLQQPTPELPQIDLMECSMCHTEKQVTSKYPITDLTLDMSSVSLFAHKDPKNPSTQQLTLQILPAEAAREEIVWSSDNTEVVIVDSDGFVSAGKNKGTATVTAYNPRTGKSASCVFTVEKNTKAKLKKLTVDKKKIKLTKGETYQIRVGVKPAKVFDNRVTWKTSDKKIAKVSKDGLVTAKKKGKCTITAVSKLDKSKKIVITVIVK